jgi:hypothetical protein
MPSEYKTRQTIKESQFSFQNYGLWFVGKIGNPQYTLGHESRAAL